MKTIIFLLCIICCKYSYSQATKDTVRVDTTRVEKINRVTLDTNEHKMPVAPLQLDTSRSQLKHDDSDPVRRKED
jgi:hypothetical protein